MAAPIFIGDEVNAAGYRLAGVRVRTPNPDDILDVIKWASSQSSLVMLTPEYAAMLSDSAHDHFLSQESPPVVVVPDIRASKHKDELANRLRSQLGVLE
jgi:vacuolar-type H+-ATPase subunit F/Vma7